MFDMTLWTIRAALGCYAAALALMLADHRAARWLWTLGALLLIAHIAAAMHFHHDWSQAAALAHTAYETRERVGIAFGGGLYFNYLFAALWLGDVVWWWLAPLSRERRPRWFDIALHGYLLFIVVNGAIVFEEGAIRWISLAVLIALAAGAWYRKGRRALAHAESSGSR